MPSDSINTQKRIPIQMPKREKVIEIKVHSSDVTSIYYPKDNLIRLDKLKIIPEEPYYKVIDRLVDHWNISNGKS